MDKPFKFLLPSPSFDKKSKDVSRAKPHFLTPSEMTLLPREKQPPPMFGQRGSTVPGKYLQPVAAKVPEPETVRQYCEPCELELQSLDDYKRHRAQHECCPVEGCKYKGHPTVMDKHITALHSSGLFEKFKKLNSPEEIAAWREERRKRYPTVANVELKQKAQEQRQKRGERLEANKNRFGKLEDKKRAQQNGKEMNNQGNKQSAPNQSNKKQRNKNKNRRSRRTMQDKSDDKLDQTASSINSKELRQEEEDVCHGFVMFRGTLQMEDYKHASNKPKAASKNALFGLVGMYGSDDDDDSEEEQDRTGNGKESDDGEQISLNCLKTCENDNNNPNQIVNCVVENVMCQDVGDTTEMSDKDVKSDQDQKHFAETSEDSSQDTTLINNNVISPIVNSLEGVNKATPGQIEAAIFPSDLNSDSNPLPIQPLNENSSDESPEETPIQRSVPEYQMKSELPAASNITSTAQAEETSQKPTKQQSTNNGRTRQMLKRKSGLDYRRIKLRKQNTMLEKLLETDIRHERNVLLQCVRHVCENKFFEVGVKHTTDKTTF